MVSSISKRIAFSLINHTITFQKVNMKKASSKIMRYRYAHPNYYLITVIPQNSVASHQYANS